MLLTLAHTFLNLLYIVSTFLIIALLIFIESTLSKGNKQREMKHTVALCQRAYIRGEKSCIYPGMLLKEIDLVYMNQMWWDNTGVKLKQDESNQWRLLIVPSNDVL
jgi:hypothetical protein